MTLQLPRWLKRSRPRPACRAPTCDDGLANGGESDIDCGVACGDESCGFRQACDGPNTCYDPEVEVVCDLTHRSCALPEAVDLVAGEEHTCALLNGGGVRCWGSNEFGQLGYSGVDHVGLADEPWEVGDVPLGGSAVQISAGRHHTCAVLTDGAVRCWGRGAGGRLGYGNEDDVGRELEPAAAGDIIVGGSALEVHAGSDFTCAMMVDGNPRCWGENGFGQLGRPHVGSIGDDETPGSVGPIGFGSPVVALAVGYVHACAMNDFCDGSIACWGKGNDYKLGTSDDQHMGDDEAPLWVNTGQSLIDLATGGRHGCALTEWGGVSPLGENASSSD